MDMHCHLLWGVDDGAHILRDSLEIISRLKEKGFRGAYCTPHISSRYPSNTPARLKARFQQLLDALPDRDFDHVSVLDFDASGGGIHAGPPF